MIDSQIIFEFFALPTPDYNKISSSSKNVRCMILYAVDAFVEIPHVRTGLRVNRLTGETELKPSNGGQWNFHDHLKIRGNNLSSVMYKTIDLQMLLLP